MAVTEGTGKAENFSNGFIVQSRIIPKSGQLYRNRKKNSQPILISEYLQRLTDQPCGDFSARRRKTPESAGNNYPAGITIYVEQGI